MRFKKVIIGGTFDLLHAGHKDLIVHAFELGEKVNVGITSDKYNKDRGKITSQNQSLRRKKLENFLEQKGFLKRSKIVFIDDIFGSSLKDPEIEAIVVTKETIPNANVVNRERIKKGLKELEIIVLPHAKDSLGKIISSTRIRNGEINTKGEKYIDLLFKIADKVIDKSVLYKLKEPLGKIIKDFKTSDNLIITVGDVTTALALAKNISPKLSIIDLKTHREPVTLNEMKGIYPSVASLLQDDNKKIIKVNNPQSVISRELILRIEKALKNKSEKELIIVEGEEDLAAVPAILLSPLGARVYYGQPNEGTVEVIVSQEIKDKLLFLLDLK